MTAPAGIPLRLSGEFIPAIDMWTFAGGLGLIVPWGAGATIRESMLNNVESSFAGAKTPESQQMAALMNSILPAGITNYNYYFEGLIGPQGVPGPPGPTSLVFARDVDGHTLNAPVRVIDDGAVPATVANVSATALIQAVLLEWDANSEMDIDHYDIYRHTSDASGSASKILESHATLIVDGNRTGGTAYYYWVKAVDHVGNVSVSFSTSVNATPTNVETGDIVSLAAAKVLIDGAVYLSNWRKTGDVTKIDGGEISAASILAASISTYDLTAINATIENLMVKTAHIDNLNVATGKIANDAGHAYETATTSTPTDNLDTGTWTTIQSDTIVSLGSIVSIKGVANFHHVSPAGPTDVQIALYEDTTQIAISPAFSMTALTYASLSITALNIPGSGSKTFHLKAQPAASAKIHAETRSLELQESKGK